MVRRWILVALAALSFCAGAQASELEALLKGRGMWLQSPNKFQNTQVKDLRQIGVRRVHIMVTHAPTSYKNCTSAQRTTTTTSTTKLVSIVAALEAAKIETIATVYLPPTKDAIDLLTDPNDGLLKTLVMSGVKAVEYDLEGGWSKSPPCGFKSHADAVDHLIAQTKTLSTELPVGITTHLGRANDPHVGLAKADWVSIQAYTSCRPDQCVSFTDPKEGPGFRQKRVPAAMAGYNKPMIIGLAAYQQAWPKRSVRDAMAAALDAANTLQTQYKNYLGHSYWSSYWALRPNSAELTFLAATADK